LVHRRKGSQETVDLIPLGFDVFPVGHFKQSGFDVGAKDASRNLPEKLGQHGCDGVDIKVVNVDKPSSLDNKIIKGIKRK